MVMATTLRANSPITSCFGISAKLTKFKGEKPSAYSGKNDETFNSWDAASWADTRAKLDAVLSEWESWWKRLTKSSWRLGIRPSHILARTTLITRDRSSH